MHLDPGSDLRSRPRRLHLFSAVTLLAVGAWINADRIQGLAGIEEARDERTRTTKSAQEVKAAAGMSQRHAGEEGRMGKPTTRAKSGLYAMKGPKDAIPQMARRFEPDTAARAAGILGMVEGQGGHFVASPYGAAFAVGNDEDVWGGVSGGEVGAAHGVGGLGLVGTGVGGGGVGAGYGRGAGAGFGGRGRRVPRVELGKARVRGWDGEIAEPAPELVPLHFNPFVNASEDAKSTFSIDVDTAAYANLRRHLLREQRLPAPSLVRTEELLNYFEYDYPKPSPAGEGAPFSVHSEVGPAPWAEGHRLLHIGLQGVVPQRPEPPPRNLVFLLDVSGSMQGRDRLELVKYGLAELSEQLGARDRVSIVVYAGAAGAVLQPTPGDQRQAILDALDRLEAGGSTAGAAGIELAYQLAEAHFEAEGINRVILATDGDFNVGTSDHDALISLIQARRASGVFLSVLGVGGGNLRDHTLEQLADEGNGNYAFLDGRSEARKVLVRQAGGTLETIAKDVKLQVEFDPRHVQSHRLIGYENRTLAHRDFADDRKDAGEIGAGHTVTALYEIVPTPEAAARAELGTLQLRYKAPDADRSSLIRHRLGDAGHGLDATSADFRFSAAVAAFGERMRGRKDAMPFRDILALAQAGLGADRACYRHEFLELVWAAGKLAGGDAERDLERPDTACVPGEVEPVVVEEEEGRAVSVRQLALAGAVETPSDAADDRAWRAFVVEVLRALPPLLALPLFVSAWARPRRRRSLGHPGGRG